MTKFNVQFEVPDGTEPEAIHEDLCQVLHEGAAVTVPYIDVGYPDQIPDDPENGIVAYLQDGDGNERTLLVTQPDPADGTYCVFMDDEPTTWIRVVPVARPKEESVRSIERAQSEQIDKILGFSPILVYDHSNEGKEESFIFCSPYNPARTKQILQDLIDRMSDV